jgi:hypothetical protein
VAFPRDPKSARPKDPLSNDWFSYLLRLQRQMPKAHPSSILHSDHMAIHQRRPGCMRPLSFCICFDVAGSWDDSWGNGDLTHPWQGNAGLREAATRRDSHPWMVEGLGWRLPPCIPTADPARPQIPQTAAEQSGPDLPPASFLSALALQSSTVAVKARVLDDGFALLVLPAISRPSFGQSPTAASATTTPARQPRRNGRLSELQRCRGTGTTTTSLMAREGYHSVLEPVGERLVACNPLPSVLDPAG